MKKKLNEKKDIDKSLKLVVATSFIVLIGVFLSKLFTYLYRIIIARYFGPEDYGLFSLSLIVLGWIIAVSSLGLSDGLTRFIPLYRGKNKYTEIKYLSKFVFSFLLVSSIISGILLFLFSEVIALNLFNSPNLTVFLKIFSILIPITVLSNFFLSIIKGFEMINWYSFIINIVQSLSKLLILLVFVFAAIKTNAIALSFMLGTLVMLIISYLVSKYFITNKIINIHLKNKSKINKSTKQKIKKALISYSWPIMFSSVFLSIFYWIDSFVIGYFQGPTYVGYYNAAIPIAALFSISSDLFIQLLFPLITREYAKKRISVIKELSKQVVKWIFIINVPLFFVLIIFPGAIINILFGADYLPALTALRILAVGGFLTSTIFIICQNILSMAGKSKLILINLVIASIANLILNIILVPKYGINGAAIATSVVWTVLSIAILFQTYYLTSIIPLRRKLLNIVFASVIPLILLIIVSESTNPTLPTLIVAGAVFLALYLILIFMTKSLDRNDTMILDAIKSKLFKGKNILFAKSKILDKNSK